MKTFSEIFGWYGVAVILGAYALVSFSVIAAQSFVFQLLNASGALGIVVDSLYGRSRNIQPAILNFIWMIIAVIAIARILFKF